MKKGLIVLLIFVLVVGAFFAGANINLNNTNDLTTTALEENEKVDIDVNDTTEEMIIDKTTTKASTTEEETYSEYQPEGFAKIGRDFDTMLEVKYFDVQEDQNSWYTSVTARVGGKEGYYLESPYAAPIYTCSNWEMYEKYWNYDKEVFSISTHSDDYETFCFYDDNTLVIGEGDDEERIIIEEIITIKDNGSIIKTRIDRFGFENDKPNIYFFVTNFEKLITLPNDEVGEEVYTYGGDFAGYSERKIYFDR